MKKLLLFVALCAISSSMWAPVADMRRVDINNVRVPHIGEGVVSVEAYKIYNTRDAGKFSLEGIARIDGRDRNFRVLLLSDGETLDTSYHDNGIHIY